MAHPCQSDNSLDQVRAQQLVLIENQPERSVTLHVGGDAVDGGEPNETGCRAGRLVGASLGKLRDPAYADPVVHLHAFAREPTAAMFGLARDLFPGVDRLADLLRQVPLAEHAAELLRLLLEAQTTPLPVPWGIMDNRPVLRPIAHLAYVCKEAGKWLALWSWRAGWCWNSTPMTTMVCAGTCRTRSGTGRCGNNPVPWPGPPWR